MDAVSLCQQSQATGPLLDSCIVQVLSHRKPCHTIWFKTLHIILLVKNLTIPYHIKPSLNTPQVYSAGTREEHLATTVYLFGCHYFTTIADTTTTAAAIAATAFGTAFGTAPAPAAAVLPSAADREAVERFLRRLAAALRPSSATGGAPEEQGGWRERQGRRAEQQECRGLAERGRAVVAAPGLDTRVAMHLAVAQVRAMSCPTLP